MVFSWLKILMVNGSISTKKASVYILRHNCHNLEREPLFNERYTPPYRAQNNSAFFVCSVVKNASNICVFCVICAKTNLFKSGKSASSAFLIPSTNH